MFSKSTKQLTLLLIVIISQISFSYAQRIKAGFGVSAASYTGDLSSWTPRLSETKMAFAFNLSYDITNQFRIRFDFTNGTISGSDRKSPRQDLRERNLSFKSKITEFALLAEYEFYLSEEPRFVPYVFAGPGIFMFDPTTVDRFGKTVYLRNVGTEGQFLSSNPPGKGQLYDLTQMNMQYGIGVKTQLTDNMWLGMEMSFRQLFTDYLDDVHANRYVDPAFFLAEGQTQAMELSFRGRELTPQAPQFLELPRGLNNRDAFQTLQLKLIVGLKSNNYYNFSGPGKGSLNQMRCKKMIL
ncbi:MAG: DUF6089 family protein [Chitinophagaceae bacterium]